MPLCAIKGGRRGLGTELSSASFVDSVRYLQAQELKASTPSLFDLIDLEASEVEDEVPA